MFQVEASVCAKALVGKSLGRGCRLQMSENRVKIEIEKDI